MLIERNILEHLTLISIMAGTQTHFFRSRGGKPDTAAAVVGVENAQAVPG